MAKPTRFTQEMMDEYLYKGLWLKESIADLWDQNARLIPEKEALIDSRRRMTWLQVKDFSDRIGLGFLRLGYKKDEVMFVLLPNCTDSFFVRLACEKAGILSLTGLPTLRETEIEYVVNNFNVKGITIPWQFRNFDYYRAVADMRSRLPSMKDIFITGDKVPAGTHSIEKMAHEPESKEFPLTLLEKTGYTATEVATIGLTSGTTGRQKAAEHTPANRIAVGTAYQRVVNLKRDDVVLNGLSAVAGRGGAFCYSQPQIGAKTVCMEIWNAEEALKLIQREKATILFTAPAQLAMMVNLPVFGNYDTSSLRCVVCATSPLEKDLIIDAEKKLGIPILNGYGSFDSGGVSGTKLDDDIETRHNTMGKPYPGVEIKVVDDNGNEVPVGQEGELLHRGHLTAAGYYRDMERTLEAWGTLGREGWFRSGDIVKLDQKGNIVMTGRKKDMVIRGGQNIYPIEIEELLVTHPKVAKAAVVGMPDPIMGEKACAYVVLKGEEKLTFEEMKSFLQCKKIAPYKIPERLDYIDEIPMRNFKIVKAVLREDVTKKLKAEGKI
jgi:non-ribosomal peptide synthetase component E (peptide arylation enzyme)